MRGLFDEKKKGSSRAQLLPFFFGIPAKRQLSAIVLALRRRAFPCALQQSLQPFTIQRGGVPIGFG